MPSSRASSYVAFAGPRRIAAGDLRAVALAAKASVDADQIEGRLRIFDDATGRAVDVDLRGTREDVLARLPHDSDDVDEDESDIAAGSQRRGPGRPRLGVVSKEVTLLPRHWAWLRAQRAGASATLRRLIDEARRTHEKRDAVRRAQDSAYRFMAATVGNEPSFEEAIRALYRCDGDRFASESEGWPRDLKAHIRKLAADAFSGPVVERPHTSVPEKR